MSDRVPVGEKLGYQRKLEATDSWPPARIRHQWSEVPPATPYLVVAADGNDAGDRPIAGVRALRNASVEVIDAGGNVVAQPVQGIDHRIRVRVTNRGAAPCYAGIAEFAIGEPAVLDSAARGVGAVPVFGVTGFSVYPNATVTVTCPRVWHPRDATEAALSAVVNVADLFLDPVSRRLDGRADRHVGRKDYIPDFAGTWQGQEILQPAGGAGTLTRMVITQNGLTVTAANYSATEAGLPADPQWTQTQPIVNGAATFTVVDLLFPGSRRERPISTSVFTLTLADPDTLHVAHHRQSFLNIFPAQDLVADLKRVP